MISTGLLDRLVSRILEKRHTEDRSEVRQELAAESARLQVTETAAALLVLHREGEDCAAWAQELEADLVRSPHTPQTAERQRNHPRDDEA